MQRDLTDDQIDAIADAYRWDTREGRRALVRAALASAPAADLTDDQIDACVGNLGMAPYSVLAGPDEIRKFARKLLGAASAPAAEATAWRIVWPSGQRDYTDRRDVVQMWEERMAEGIGYAPVRIDPLSTPVSDVQAQVVATADPLGYQLPDALHEAIEAYGCAHVVEDGRSDAKWQADCDAKRIALVAAIRNFATEQPRQAQRAALNVDALAHEIRRVDGNHQLGAGALATALMPYITSRLKPAVPPPEQEQHHDDERI